MKVTKQVEVAICDFCKKQEALYYKCTACEKDICYDCCETEAVKYSHTVHSSRSGDGVYCHNCDEANKADPLHRAYARIATLRREANSFGEDFKKRSDEAEAALKRVQEQQSATA